MACWACLGLDRCCAGGLALLHLPRHRDREGRDVVLARKPLVVTSMACHYVRGRQCSKPASSLCFTLRSVVGVVANGQRPEPHHHKEFVHEGSALVVEAYPLATKHLRTED